MNQRNRREARREAQLDVEEGADEAMIVVENLQAMRRAGADVIIIYHARDALARNWL